MTDYQAMMELQDRNANYRDMDERFRRGLLHEVRNATMTSIPRLFDLYKTVEYIVDAGIPGDILECGVWLGGSMMLAAKVLLDKGDTDRTLWLFDTFTGLPMPNPDETALDGTNCLNWWREWARNDGTSDMCRAEIEEVRENMLSTGYPPDKIRLVKGLVEDTFDKLTAPNLVLLRIDTDFYSGTRTCMEWWPLISEGGFLIVDDYGNFSGQRKAVDEYFSENRIVRKMHRIDYSCRTIQK